MIMNGRMKVVTKLIQVVCQQERAIPQLSCQT